MDWLSHISQINWLAVLLAFVSSMVIGFVWYMPAVLGRRWMQAIGKTEDDLKNIDGGAGIWVPMMLAAAVTSILLAILLSALGINTFWAAGVFALIPRRGLPCRGPRDPQRICGTPVGRNRHRFRPRHHCHDRRGRHHRGHAVAFNL